MKISKELMEEMSEIDLMKEMNTSDTIIMDTSLGEYIYINSNTGIKSRNFSETIRNKRYILVVNDARFFIKGYLSKYFPEHKVLMSVIYVLEKADKNHYQWLEYERVINNRDDYVVFTKEGIIHSYQNTYMGKEIIPLCGQFIHSNNAPDVYLYKEIINLPGQSADEIRQYCKGALWINGICHIPNYNCILEQFIIATDKMFLNVCYGKQKYWMDNIRTSRRKIPKHIIGRLEKLAADNFKKCEAANMSGLKILFDGFNAGILENCGGEYVFRIYCFYPCGNMREDGTMPVGYTEIKQIRITNLDVLQDMSLICLPLIYFDRKGIEEGPFKYAVKHLEWAEKQTHDAIGELLDVVDYNVGTLCFPYVMAFFPMFEKLYNMLYTSWSLEKSDMERKRRLYVMYGSLKNTANLFIGNVEYELTLFLGHIYPEETELHKALGISKGMLKLLGKGSITFIDTFFIKSTFEATDGFPEFMDEENTILFIDFLEKVTESQCSDEDSTTCLLTLVSQFGVKDFKKYIKFLLNEYVYSNSIHDYMNYITKVAFIKKELEDLGSMDAFPEWKVSLKNLDKASDAISGTFCLLNDKKNYSVASQKFKQLICEWEKYEYKNDVFAVVCPKSPTDFSEEGIRLRHCVKNFIERAANGETIIMFIRKCSNLRRPFYTLEITRGCIEQCHGFGNCNASEYEGLMEFIESFANEKGLVINDIDEQRG